MVGSSKERAQCEFCSVSNDPIIIFEKVQLYLRLGDLRAKNIQRGRKFIGKHFYRKRLHGKLCQKYLLYEKKAQAGFLRSIAMISTGVSDKLAIATATAQQEEERHKAKYMSKCVLRNRHDESLKASHNHDLYHQKGVS